MEFKKASLTSDIIIVYRDKKTRKYEILLIKRKGEPFKDSWAIPGGFVDLINDETFEQAAYRELKEETDLEIKNLRFFKVYDAPKRDPRDRVVSCVYYAWTDDPKMKEKAKAKDDAKELAWFNFKKLPELAFDHANILKNFYDTIVDF